MHRQQWLIMGLALLVGSAAGAQGRSGKSEPAKPGAGIEAYGRPTDAQIDAAAGCR